MAVWRRCGETGQPYDIEGRRHCADGAYRWFQMHGFPLRDAEGRIVYWFLLERDIDDQKRAEKRLLEMVALEPLPVVLDALCRFVEDTASGCCCSVVLFDLTLLRTSMVSICRSASLSIGLTCRSSARARCHRLRWCDERDNNM
jgi:hypothetical protein